MTNNCKRCDVKLDVRNKARRFPLYCKKCAKAYLCAECGDIIRTSDEFVECGSCKKKYHGDNDLVSCWIHSRGCCLMCVQCADKKAEDDKFYCTDCYNDYRCVCGHRVKDPPPRSTYSDEGEDTDDTDDEDAYKPMKCDFCLTLYHKRCYYDLVGDARNCCQ